MPPISLTIRLPNGDRQYISLNVVPAPGETLHVAGEDWIVADVRQASNGAFEVVLARSDVFGHSPKDAN